MVLRDWQFWEEGAALLRVTGRARQGGARTANSPPHQGKGWVPGWGLGLGEDVTVRPGN